MKAKQSSGLNHTTTGRRGFLALHDYLPCAGERAGRQEAASNPSAGSHLLSPGPWDPLWLLREGGRPREQQRQARSCPRCWGMGEEGAGIQPRLPGAKEKQRGEAGVCRPEKPSHLAWREKGGPCTKWSQCRSHPVNLFTSQNNTLRVLGCLSLSLNLPDSSSLGPSTLPSAPCLSLCFCVFVLCLSISGICFLPVSGCLAVSLHLSVFHSPSSSISSPNLKVSLC